MTHDFDEKTYRKTLSPELQNLPFPEPVVLKISRVLVFDELICLTDEEANNARKEIESSTTDELVEKLAGTVCLYPVTGEWAVDPRERKLSAIILELQRANKDLLFSALAVPYGYPFHPDKVKATA